MASQKKWRMYQPLRQEKPLPTIGVEPIAVRSGCHFAQKPYHIYIDAVLVFRGFMFANWQSSDTNWPKTGVLCLLMLRITPKNEIRRMFVALEGGCLRYRVPVRRPHWPPRELSLNFVKILVTDAHFIYIDSHGNLSLSAKFPQKEKLL